jgi:hypothetical protein
VSFKEGTRLRSFLWNNIAKRQLTQRAREPREFAVESLAAALMIIALAEQEHLSVRYAPREGLQNFGNGGHHSRA